MKKILIVADVPGWIFDSHAHELKNRISEYEIDIAYLTKQDIISLADNYDCVYLMDPFYIKNYPHGQKTIMGVRCEWLYGGTIVGAKKLYEKGTPGVCNPIKGNCRRLHVVNSRQLGILTEVCDIPVELVQHGVNTQLFNYKKHFKPLQPKKKDQLVLGMVGNQFSKGNKNFDVVYEAVFTMHEYYEEHIRIFPVFPKRGYMVEKKDMPRYYKSVDVIFSLSESEGLNNVILEAGAMGVPVVSSFAGAAPEIIRHEKNGLLVDIARDDLIEYLKSEIILKYYHNPKVLHTMGLNLKKDILKNWSWDTKYQEYKQMFDNFFDKG